MLNIKKIRKDFPILEREVHPGKKLIYLDNAASSQKPKQVIDAIKDFYENHNANIHRGVHKLSEESTEMYDEAHKKVASFIGTKYEEEIIFTRNASESINLVMHSLNFDKLKKGDEIVTTVMEHHSNIVPWIALKEKGVKTQFVDINNDGTLKIEEFQDKINKNTKVVTVIHASNVLGTINDVKEIGKIAHENEALFLVDAAQSVPHMEVDVKKIGCDFLAFSGHKMAGPTGIGGLYGKKEILEEMSPFMFGGDMIKEVYLDHATWNDLPWKFEAGTSNIAGGIGLGATVDYLKNIGMNNIRQHEIDLTQYTIDKMKDIDNIRFFGPKDTKIKGGVISFEIKGIHPHDVASILDTEGIAIRSGHHCAQPLMNRLGVHATSRASFYLYNTKEEIDKLILGLEKVKKTFKL